MIAALSSSTGDVILASGVVLILLVVVLTGRRLSGKVGSVQVSLGQNGKPLHDAVAEIRAEQQNIRAVADRIESNQGDVIGRLDAHGEELARLSERVAALEAPPEPSPIRKKSPTPRKRTA